MAKNKVQKEEALKEAKDRLKSSKLTIITSYKNLPVSQVEKIRKELREQGIFYKVIKKTILKLAASENIDESAIDDTKGNLTVAFGNDEVAAARILAKFAKENEGLEIHGGWLEDKFMSKSQVEELSKILSKEELLSKLLRTMNNPMTGFVNVLSGNMRGLVNVLKAISEKK
ncbi:MAG: 50S ribosomal protein L10 [Patescibacteria group bacterium]|nr:50S ribosomal protein L10 [Patescibacteria group bacterium]MDD4304882.1 50S ribosomal protein L10 [Patescibacteria group bacterium]MDD4695850.1 50S ribosomal protein L10 [Patescibacteria group bacterium]